MNEKEIPQSETFWLEEGIFNPRDKDYSYRFYGQFNTKDEAIKQYRKMEHARILVVRAIAIK